MIELSAQLIIINNHSVKIGKETGAVNKMKKILAALLACMMLFSLAACGRNSSSNEGNSSPQSGNTVESENEISQTPEQKNNTNQTDSTKGGAEKEKMITMNVKVGNRRSLQRCMIMKPHKH